MEKCNCCGKELSDGIEYTNIPHTDVYYCDKCLRNNRHERSKRDDCTLCETVTMNENGEDYLVRMRCSEHSGN